MWQSGRVKEEVWDVIVVGARCAGSPLAMLLARKGYRVLLLDRANFPSDTISSHLVHQTGLARMKRWGLLDDLMATGCPPFTASRWEMEVGTIAGELIPADGVAFNTIPRRHVLDTLLASAAVAAGAQLREGFGLTRLLQDGERVVGVRGVANDGREVSERAALVVGADGRNSTVAKLAGAEKYRDDGSRTISYYTYVSGADHPDGVIYTRRDWGIAVGPTHDGLCILSMSLHKDRLPAFRADIDASFWDLIKTIPDLDDRLAGARREEPYKGLADIPNFYRQSHGPGWALAGDAGYYRDPVTAQGISDAFRDADELAATIDGGLGGSEDLEVALDRYQRERDAVTAPAYDWTLSSTAFAPDNARTRMFLRTVARDPELSRMFVNLNPGMTEFRTVIGLAFERTAAV
jgi:2-polyprenyl-6-methoxyphenol hydroxylase-like FAD-dependent oxidoreductase